ncbi:hypothetical protein F4861DRAFT_537530 [Xylaria intraflava]|nr:hypothetical protein F4861DRAFT_537530 [Xylaria intraflava]
MLANVLLVATAIGAATAQLPSIAGRDIIENRQDGLTHIGSACESVLKTAETIYLDVPTPPLDLVSALTTVMPCATPSLTGKAESDYTSYTSELAQWSATHSADLSAILSACSTDLPSSLACGLTSHLSGSAQSTAAATTSSGAGSSNAAPTGASSQAATPTPAASSQPATPTPTPTGAASRTTGLTLAAGMAVAGFMGVVAML